MISPYIFLYKLTHFSIIRCADQTQQSKSFKSLQNFKRKQLNTEGEELMELP